MRRNPGCVWQLFPVYSFRLCLQLAPGWLSAFSSGHGTIWTGAKATAVPLPPLKRWLRRCSASSMRAPAFSVAMFTTRFLRCSRRMQFHSCSRPGSPYKSDSTVRMVLREIPAYLTIHRAPKMPEPDTRSRAGISPVPAAAPTTLKTGSPSGCSAQPSPAPFAARLAPPAFSPG